MLKRISPHTPDTTENVGIPIKDAAFPVPFATGLEYGAPARGTWNIVHVGMLIPEAHQIFVCAEGCLRGVVLTAAEMGASHRFSTVEIRENNLLAGDMEDLIIDGVTDILKRLPAMPPCVLVYTSCVHHFMACDLSLVYGTLRDRFPDTDFIDCYMNPIMRKSGLTPDQLMRRQLYGALKKPKMPTDGEERKKEIGHDKKFALTVGCVFSTDTTAELRSVLSSAGWKLREITDCASYKDYLALSDASLCITSLPAAKAAGDALADKLSVPHLYLPLTYDPGEIEASLIRLAAEIGAPTPDFMTAEAAAEKALEKARVRIGDTPISIDYTATPRPLGLARLLLEHGFCVESVYADSFTGEEKEAFDVLSRDYPALRLYPTVHPAMRVTPRSAETPVLCIGQKAAYFTGSDRFVNTVEGGGHRDFDGIVQLCHALCEANETPKDTRALITVKGLGCGGCGL